MEFAWNNFLLPSSKSQREERIPLAGVVTQFQLLGRGDGNRDIHSSTASFVPAPRRKTGGGSRNTGGMEILVTRDRQSIRINNVHLRPGKKAD